MMDTEIRFWEKVEIADEDTCWLWLGATQLQGYGVFSANSKTTLAHRYSYQLHKGPIGNLCVLHFCDNPGCVNPNHLFLGTQSNNMQDMHNKNRHNKRKLTLKQLEEIRRKYIPRIYSQRELAKEYNVAQITIFDIVNYQGAYHL